MLTETIYCDLNHFKMFLDALYTSTSISSSYGDHTKQFVLVNGSINLIVSDNIFSQLFHTPRSRNLIIEHMYQIVRYR